MANDQLNNLVQAITAATQQRAAEFSAAVGVPAPGGETKSMAIAIGTPVLDLVTGQTGVVVNGKRENIVVPPPTNNRG